MPTKVRSTPLTEDQNVRRSARAAAIAGADSPRGEVALQMEEQATMSPTDLKGYAEDALEHVPEEHRYRGIAAGVGAAVGGVVGSVLGGPVGAAVGASIGGAVGVAVGEKAKSGGNR